MQTNYLKNKKILLVGLGQLGGGLNSAKFLASQGAKLTITDLKTEKDLKKIVNKLKGLKVKFTLGQHKEEDFKNNDIIIFNQDVSVNSPWVKLAQKYKKQIETDLTLFLKIIAEEKPELEYIAITGTRGKTTTTAWTHHFLKPAIMGGNIPTAGPLKILKQTMSFAKAGSVVLEIPSYQFEYWALNKNLKAPKVALITNLYVDHLNRHGNMKNYALAKAEIFSHQTKNDFLILNFDDKNKKMFLARKPKARIFYISLKSLPKKENGLFFVKDKIYFQKNRGKELIAEVKSASWRVSPHQKYNLLSALLAAHLYGREWENLIKRIPSLPSVPFRQELILKNKSWMVINDSTGTSPEGTMAAVERFKSYGKKFYLICGGTDKDLDFKNLAKAIKNNVIPQNLYLLNGSATQKLIKELKRLNFSKNISLFESLEEILTVIKEEKKAGTIVFSPGAASFGKFKNEFDRGKKFSKLIQKHFK